MTKKTMPLGAKLLTGWWLIVFGLGLLANFWMAYKSLQGSNLMGVLVFGTLGIGCGVILYRTYIYRHEF